MNHAAALLSLLVWISLRGDVRPTTLLLGLVLAVGIPAVSGRLSPSDPLRVRPVALLRLAAAFAYELVKSTWQVTLHVVRPRFRFRPGILAIQVGELSDSQTTLLANLVTLTPGSVALGVSADRKSLFVHAFDARDPDKTRSVMLKRLEPRTRAAIR